jgi:S-adenosylmethionine uptake transporter
MAATRPVVAFAVAIVGIAVFSGMDALMKGLVLAIGVYNALLWRGLAGVATSGAPYLLRPHRRPTRTAMRLHVLRGVVSTAMGLLFFWSLGQLPMAQAIALTHIAPLLSLFLAAWLLGEPVRRRTVLASLLALAGVALILIGQGRAELGQGAFLGAMAAIGSAICYAWNIVLMRQQALVAGPPEIAFYQSVVVTAVLALAAPWLAAWPTGQWPAILSAALLTVASLFLLSWAYARAEASYLAPTEYTAFVWAAILGFLVFGERVSPWTLAGAAFIIGGCVWAARRRDGVPVADAEAALP